MTIRENFPKQGEIIQTEVYSGVSDGWKLNLTFNAATYECAYINLHAFLKSEGYGDVVLPISYNELSKHIPQGLFAPGFIQEPIVIKRWVPQTGVGLWVFLHNDRHPQHKRLWSEEYGNTNI